MTTEQVLWSMNTGLIAVVFFVIKAWVAKVDLKLDNRVNVKSCDERHKEIKENNDKLFRHKHAPANGHEGGEVIIP